MNTEKSVYELEKEIESLKKELAMLRPQVKADISAVVAVTDNETALKDCLDVLLMQRSVALEVICIYSGSSERIVNMLRKYSASDNRITVYRVTDKAMNRIFQYGVQFSCAEYITFLSVNCWYANENVLQTLYETAKENGADACGGASRRFDVKSDEKNISGGMYRYRDLGDDEILSCYLFRKSAVAQKVNELPELLYYYGRPFAAMLLNEMEFLYRIDETVCVRRAVKNDEIDDLYLCAEITDAVSERSLRAVSDYLNSAEFGLRYSAKNGLGREYANIYRRLLAEDQLAAVADFYRAEAPQIVSSVKRLNDMLNVDMLEKEGFYAYDNMYHIALFGTLRRNRSSLENTAL